MVRKLREAATAVGDRLPDRECLVVMICRWETGRCGITERYRLHYCKAFDIPIGEFGGHPAGAAKATASEISGKGALYAAFWVRFLEALRAKHPGWSRARKGSADNWLSMPSPARGGWSSYGVNFPRGPEGQQLRCELYIDSADPSEVERHFGELSEHRETIDATFGAPLSWEPLEGRRASRIACYGSGDITEVDQHGEYVSWFLSNLERLRAALDPCLLRR